MENGRTLKEKGKNQFIFQWRNQRVDWGQYRDVGSISNLGERRHIYQAKWAIPEHKKAFFVYCKILGGTVPTSLGQWRNGDSRGP